MLAKHSLSRRLRFGVLALCLSSAAAPLRGMPENDDFFFPITLEGRAGQVAGTNRGATAQFNEDTIAHPAGGASIWYRWIPDADGEATLYTFGSDFDSILLVALGDELATVQFVRENDDTDDGYGSTFQSWLTFRAFAGREYRIAIDGFNRAQGNTLLSWFLDTSSAGPANQRFADRQSIDGPSGRVWGTTEGALREVGEPDHFGESSGNSIWFSWVAPADGDAVLDTSTSDFRTTLSAYTGVALDSLTRVAQSGPGPRFGEQSRVQFPILAGEEYQIAVDGSEGDRGVVSLRWLFTVACRNPSRPNAPVPPDGEFDAPRSITLRWNQDLRVARAAIFGDDNRRDIFGVEDPRVAEAAEAVALVVRRNVLIDEGDGNVRLTGISYGEARLLCEGQRFREQLSAGSCSAFLVGPDLLATAGSCLADATACEDAAFVFGYRMLDAENGVTLFAEDDVYHCAGFVGVERDASGASWAIIRLDREVVGRRPLRLRRFGEVSEDGELLTIGHPGGLAVKLSAGGAVRANEDDRTFTAEIDAFDESLGSPVLDAATFIVEGLVSRDPDVDYEPAAGGCSIVRICDDSCAGATVTRTDVFGPLVPPDLADVSYEVQLGLCGEPLETLGVTSATEWVVETRLALSSSYCWRVIARNECGAVQGPEWTFITNATRDLVFRRGDANEDDVVNLSDGIFALRYLFQGGAAPSCLKGLDTDDNGSVNLSDPILILNHLFSQGPAPAAPFAECGIDSSPDDLPCDTFAPCA